MSGIEIHKEPDYAYRLHAPCAPAATATFDVGDPVQLATNQLSDCPDDAGELIVGEIIGFACEPAEGTTAGSRATAAADGFGVVENQPRTYWPFNAPGLLLRTRNYWVATGFAAAGNAAKSGTSIGDSVVIAGINTTNVWGFEAEVPTYAAGAGEAGTVAIGDDAAFIIVDILDDDMQTINADATQTAGDGWLVVRPVGLSQMEYGGA